MRYYTDKLNKFMTEHFMKILMKYLRFVCISHRDMLNLANERENNLLCSEERQFSRVIASYILSKQ